MLSRLEESEGKVEQDLLRSPGRETAPEERAEGRPRGRVRVEARAFLRARGQRWRAWGPPPGNPFFSPPTALVITYWRGLSSASAATPVGWFSVSPFPCRTAGDGAGPKVRSRGMATLSWSPVNKTGRTQSALTPCLPPCLDTGGSMGWVSTSSINVGTQHHRSECMKPPYNPMTVFILMDWALCWTKEHYIWIVSSAKTLWTQLKSNTLDYIYFLFLMNGK